MPITAGRHKLGPHNATLSIRTKKSGAAAMAGHNLLIEVTAWAGTLEVGEDLSRTKIELTADAGSLNVIEGTGGAITLGDGDKAGIKQTIEEEVLKGTAIEFHSTAVEAAPDGEHLSISGELDLAGKRKPIDFELSFDGGGAFTGAATVKQSNWGIKPYSALFGTLKVVDEVTVEIAATVPAS
jgi:polyisoprenoid-binding protein YceI